MSILGRIYTSSIFVYMYVVDQDRICDPDLTSDSLNRVEGTVEVEYARFHRTMLQRGARISIDYAEQNTVKPFKRRVSIPCYMRVLHGACITRTRAQYDGCHKANGILRTVKKDPGTSVGGPSSPIGGCGGCKCGGGFGGRRRAGG